MAGLDEASARSVLATMQERLTRDPSFALGLDPGASPDEIRAAFLSLTKLFHPVRFGRMPPDVQKLSNEVFLALRAAHDSLAKASRRGTGPVPVARAAGSGPAHAPSPAAGSATAGATAGSSAAAPRPTRPATPPDRPGPAAPGARPTHRTATPVAGVSVPGITTHAPSGPSTRPLGARPPVPSNAPPAGARDEAAAIELLTRQQWEPARTILHQLLAREPGSKRIRALMSYAKGREAQLERRLDDARVELQDALDLDPNLQLAKDALTELFTRRK